MAKRRTPYLLLSLASGALASAALLPGCSGTETSSTPGAGAGSGSGGVAGAAEACGPGRLCGSVVMPNGGATTVVTGIVIAPSGGAGGTASVGLVIQPGEAGATGEAGDTSTSQGGTGPCGGHVCGSIISLGGNAGNAGAKP